MPMVLLKTSLPSRAFFSHLDCFMNMFACGMLRVRAIIMAMVCSPVVTVLPPGVFMTTMPCLLAAGMSMLSTPAPARPMTLSFFPAEMISGVALVAERTTRPSYSPMIFLSSSGLRPVLTSTSKPPFFRISTPFSDNLSLTSIFIPTPSLTVESKSAALVANGHGSVNNLQGNPPPELPLPG